MRDRDVDRFGTAGWGREKLGTLGLGTFGVGLLALSTVALAQQAPVPPVPPAGAIEAVPEKVEPDGRGLGERGASPRPAEEGATTDETLGEQLGRSGGVIRPPPAVDPGIVERPPPIDSRMPVIEPREPPGPPPTVQPPLVKP